MSSYVLGFQDIDQSHVAVVGGKGANLGELARLEGIRVPEGFCVSTAAFQRAVGESPAVGRLLERLSRLEADDREGIREWSGELRRVIEAIALPQAIEEAIAHALARLGESEAYAVRSSATAEDLPTASFAGQHDTFLNVLGLPALLASVSRCWASLFTERAVTYRLQQGFDHRQVRLAVVVQKMVFPQAAGVMFTADPVTSHRKVVAIDASFGLGEALVAGLVNADRYRVREGRIIEKQVSTKELAIDASAAGGTAHRALERERQNQPVLTDEQIRRLERIGRRVEAHFGHPQDIEWCLADEEIHLVQSRPITTLFPLPDAGDQDRHLYVSVGHQQMMTDAFKPLGLSVWRVTAARPMYTAGGRLFVDIMPSLMSPAGRHVILNVLGKSDLLVKDAVLSLVERGDFIDMPPDGVPAPAPDRLAQALSKPPEDYDPQIVTALIDANRLAVDALKEAIRTQSGPALFDFIRQDLQAWRSREADSQSLGVLMAGIDAASWLNDHMADWLGEKNVADALSLSVPHNVTSEMGLALLDVADAIRPHPDVVRCLEAAKDDGFLDELVTREGGREARDAIGAFLACYGMRCVGEIDITRPRWAERPSTLIPMMLGNVKNCEPGASRRKFEQGLETAAAKERELMERLRALPDGEHKARETKRQIDRLRHFCGYREYPKYGMVSRYALYKQALLREADRLVQSGAIREREDIYFLTFDELEEAVRLQQVDERLITGRKAEFKRFEQLTPPRVMTSDGEIVMGRFQWENLPADALVGLPVSSGVVEGRARVVSNLEDAVLDEGDILVTAFTDPSWTPVFVSIKGLVTEVGGLMTHGAVIAREYGLPAVVSVEQATKRIQDGQRIRVNGTDGYVEIL